MFYDARVSGGSGAVQSGDDGPNKGNVRIA